MQNKFSSNHTAPKIRPTLIKTLEQTAFLREKQILGDPKADPPTHPIVPVKRSTWWQGIKEGRFPAPVKLSPRCTAWRSQDIIKLIIEINAQGEEELEDSDETITHEYDDDEDDEDDEDGINFYNKSGTIK